jgi:CheY-like chemotaxis protein
MHGSPDLLSQADTPLLALLADRDADTRTMYAEYLRMSSYRVEESEDGRDALVKAFTIHPDVIVAETRLAGINGYELCKLLRQDTATRTISIVIVTADAFAVDLQRAEIAGADTVLVKPCLPEQLHTEIQRLARQSSDLRQRSRATRERLHEQLAKSDVLIERSRKRRTMLNSVHERRDTTVPPIVPPTLICPTCDHSLQYLRSHVGGVSALNSEQWDYYECAAGCGTFQYRQRTRKLRQV